MGVNITQKKEIYINLSTKHKANSTKYFNIEHSKSNPIKKVTKLLKFILSKVVSIYHHAINPY